MNDKFLYKSDGTCIINYNEHSSCNVFGFIVKPIHLQLTHIGNNVNRFKIKTITIIIIILNDTNNNIIIIIYYYYYLLLLFF